MAHDRRSFFRRVVGAAAALVAVPACLKKEPPTEDDFDRTTTSTSSLDFDSINPLTGQKQVCFYRDTANNLIDKLWGERTEPKVPFGMEHLSI